MSESKPSKWRISMFGPLRLARDGQTLARFQTQKTASLLAYLALNPGRHVPREFLCDLLWPQADPNAARNSLNQAVSWIRRHLETNDFDTEQIVRADRHSIALSFDRITTDVQEFLELIEPRGPEEDTHARRQRLEAAISLYEGEFLQGQGDGWAKIERLMLGDAYVRTLQQLGACCESMGDYEAAIQWLRSVIKVEPLQEDHHERLVQLYARTDQTGAIHRHFSDYEALMHSHDRTPSRQLRELVSKLLESQRPRAVVSLSDALQSQDDRLPLQMTRFFGRHDEIEAAVERIRGGARLVTLHGMSGVGKTRLSVEVARVLSNSFDDCFFVALADVPEEREIAAEILSQLGVKAIIADSPSDQLVKRLAHASKTLIVLDNLDHLVDSGLPTLKKLIRSLPNVFVLATSQTRLGLSGEQTMPIHPLPIPEPQADLEDLIRNPSLQLYLDRGAAVDPGFKLTAQNVAHLVDLCRQLEGLPLAIELAAAWTGTCSPQETLQELSNRFDLLVSRSPDAPDRHKSLRASLTYSYQLLPAELRSLLAELTVFEGGWTVSAASAVLGRENLLEAIRRLQDRSLVVAAVSESEEGSTRFQMLQTLREFGAEQLPDVDRSRLQAAHARYFSDLASEAHREAFGARRAGWTARLEHERPNILSALRWCKESGEHALGLCIAAKFGWYWRSNGPLEEASAWLNLFLAQTDPNVNPDIRSEALRILGHVEFLRAAHDPAHKAFSEALELDRRRDCKSGIAGALAGLSAVALRRSEFERAKGLLLESIEICSAIRDNAGLVQAHGLLACVLCDMHEFEPAKFHFDACLALESAEQNVEGIARVYCNLGRWARVQNRLALAKHYCEESLRLCSTIGNRRLTAHNQLNLSVIASLSGDRSAACQRLAESFTYFSSEGDILGFRCGVAELVQLGAALGRFEEAAALMGVHDVVSEQSATTMSPEDQEIYEAACRAVRSAVTQDEIERGHTAAVAMPFDRMAEFARSALSSLASAAQNA